MIAQDAFHQLSHLVELDLSQNLLTSVPTESFRSLINVKRLLLRQNPIKSLKENNFVHITKLEHLDLSHCQIDQIEGGSFRSLQSLKSLKLNDNRLTTLASNVFNDIPPLYTIALEDNPWNCDCELRPLHKWISDNNMLLEPPQCKTPTKFENRHWSKMYIDELACLPIMLPTDTDNSGRLGGNATFRCRIKSSPKPDIDWHVEEPNNLLPSNTIQQQSPSSPPYTLNTPYSNNNPASSEERVLISENLTEIDDVIISTFTLINLQPEDAQRKFICNAKNQAGIGKETFTVNVYSASTGVLKGKSISYTILIFAFILIGLLIVGLFLFARNRKQNKSQSGSSNGGLNENKLDVIKNVKNSLVGNHHIKKNTTSTTNNLDNQNNKIDSQKLKINTTDSNTNGLYLNGYANGKAQQPDLMNSNATKFNNSSLNQFNQSILSPYAPNLNSTGLTVLNQNGDMSMQGDLINYDQSRMINVGPQDFNTGNQANLLASSQYGTSFVQSSMNPLMPYQTNAPGSNYLDANQTGYLGSNEQLLNGGFSNYENMYSPFNQQQQYLMQQQQNAYSIYSTTQAANLPAELQMQTTITQSANPALIGEDMNSAAAVYYHQNTLGGKRNSPLISNNISQNNLPDIYATIQNPQLTNLQQHHVNILGQGSYNLNAQPAITQSTVVRYSPGKCLIAFNFFFSLVNSTLFSFHY